MNTPTIHPDVVSSVSDENSSSSLSVRIFSAVENGELVHNVDARELHKALKVGKHFNCWIKDRIKNNLFEAKKDYYPILGNNTGMRGKPRIEYKLSMDMAKELCMLERNETGSKWRKYFIECEKEFQKVSKQLNTGNPDAEKQFVESLSEFRREITDIKKLKSQLYGLKGGYTAAIRQAEKKKDGPTSYQMSLKLQQPDIPIPEHLKAMPKLISESQAAKFIGVSQATMNLWRNGKAGYEKEFVFTIYPSPVGGRFLYDELEVREYTLYKRVTKRLMPHPDDLPQSHPQSPAPPIPIPEESEPARPLIKNEELYTFTDLSEIWNISYAKIIRTLYESGIIKKEGVIWNLDDYYTKVNPPLGKLHEFPRIGENGKLHIDVRLVWTQKGLIFLRDVFRRKLNEGTL